eukprot:997568-Rhodomonas_salina.2
MQRGSLETARSETTVPGPGTGLARNPDKDRDSEKGPEAYQACPAPLARGQPSGRCSSLAAPAPRRPRS